MERVYSQGKKVRNCNKEGHGFTKWLKGTVNKGN